MSGPPAPRPWYLAVPVTLAAWFAAVFFGLFLAGLVAMGPGFDGAVLLVLGAISVGGAAALSRASTGLFTDQLALAVSGGGHVAVLVGVAELLRWPDPWILPVTSAVLCVALYGVHTQATHRFLSVLSVVLATTFWLGAERAWAAGHLVAAGSVLAGGFLLTRGAPGREHRPAILALVFGGPLTTLVLNHRASYAWFSRSGPGLAPEHWLAAFLLAGGTVALLRWLAPGASLRTPPLSLACTVTLALAALGMPGVMISIGLMALGFLRRDAAVSTLGVVFLPLFLGTYYYSLDVDLYTKSLLLMGSGAALLLARLALPARPGGEVAA